MSEHFFSFPSDSDCNDWPQLLQQLRAQSHQREYRQWTQTLSPRTCLLLQWLHTHGAVADPGDWVHRRASRLAEKSALLGNVVERNGGTVLENTSALLHNGDFDIYVAWLMWLRFREYVPARFVLAGGRERVLLWVREQLGREELSANETLRELQWQAARIGNSLEEIDPQGSWRAHGMN